MSQAVTTYGTTLEWGTSASNTTMKIEIKSFPDLGGAPTLHDVSTFLNKMKVTIPGRQELDGLEFSYFLAADASNYDEAAADAGTQLFYKLKFGPDGSVAVFEWQGEHTTWVNGADGDAPIECTIQIAPSTDITRSGVMRTMAATTTTTGK